MSKRHNPSTSVTLYSAGVRVKTDQVRGGPAPGYVGKRKASAAAKAARRRADW